MPDDPELAKQQKKNHEFVGKNKSLSESKPTYVADPFLQPFRDPSFDPVDYLNGNLPSLSRSKSNPSEKGSSSLTELSSVAQTLVSQLSANTTRLTTTLTQLTDEILRSGSRLTYEVEILRGNTLNLSEALTEVLHDDLARFVPAGLEYYLTKNGSTAVEVHQTHPHIATDRDHVYLQELRTLTLVRTRLEAVIKTFSDAMAWNFPPSEISTASSFLSVSGPNPGSGAHGYSMEEKGQHDLKRIRNEIANLLSDDDPISGIEAATKRVEELKNLAIVWKGTLEEKPRKKFVDSLVKMVEDRHRVLLRDTEQESRLRREPKNSQGVENEDEQSKLQTGYGFISQLQKLRGPS